MARAPRVSVILPCHEHAPYVREAVASVLSQSFQDFELIVTDDGSRDGTADVVRGFGDLRIRLEVFPERRGYPAALNASLARARGEFVALHCSDDVFLPGKLERQVAFLDTHPGIAAVFGKPVFLDGSSQPVPEDANPFARMFLDDQGSRFAWLRVFMLRGNALCHPTALIRRTVFDGIGGYDPLLFQLQDYDLWVRLCARHDIKVLGEHVTGYRVLEGRNTSWPGAETRRRTAWEKRRVLRRFLAMDAAVIRRTLGAELSALGLPDGMPPHIGMALLLAETSDDPARQAFALDVLEQAVEGGEFETGAFFRLSGRLDPFRVQRTLDDAERLAQAERRATEAEALACQVTSSATWRSTAPLRRLVASQPLLRGMLRRLSPRPPAPEEPSLPPAVAPVAHPPATGQATPPEWEHVPEGWRADDPRRLGWNHPSVAETQRRKWPGFLETLQGTRPLGIYHEAARIGSEDPAAHNFVLAFAYVLARAAAGRNAVSVLDWGGGIGHYAAIARAVLPEVRLDYTVLDLPDLCATGRELLPDVRFVSDAGAWSSRRYDLVFASGALQYADDWRAVLNAFAAASARWVFLSRTPFVEEAPGFVVVQRPHSAGGYRTEYLSRVFNRPELLAAAAEADLELEREFLMVGERVAAVGAPAPFEYRGFLFAVRRPAGEAG